jgi:transcription initiation factor TFIIIB Brf1 subunit/transcription initiation factor TFIIB
MPKDIIRDARSVHLHPDVRKAALEIAENFQRHSINEGKKPATIAGTCMYMAIRRLNWKETGRDEEEF